MHKDIDLYVYPFLISEAEPKLVHFSIYKTPMSHEILMFVPKKDVKTMT